MIHPAARLVVRRSLYVNGREIDPEVYEGELPMSQITLPPGSPAFEQIIGKGMAKTSVAFTFSHKSYGTGGDVMVSVTLSHDQTKEGLEWGHYLAKNAALQFAEQNLRELQQKLVALGLTAPPSAP